MYKIIIENIYTRIEPRLPCNVNTRLYNILRYHPDGYRHTWYYKNKKWDGYNYLYDRELQRFRTGLLWRVCLVLEEDDIKFDVIDLRKIPEKIPDLKNISFDNITPYEYQWEAAAATNNNTHCVIASPTGSGKTIMIALMIKLHQHRTLIIVNSRTLLDQTVEFFDRVVPGGIGIIGSGDFILKNVTVATMQSIGTILRLSTKQQKRDQSSKEQPLRDWLSSVGTVIHDEVHEADNKSVDSFYGKLSAYRFIGTTATPYAWAHSIEKGKNLEMEQHFGRKEFDSRGKVDFISIGITVPLYIIRTNMPRIDKFKYYRGERFSGEYRDVVREQVIENEQRTEAVSKLVGDMVNNGRSCYVYYKYIKHGEMFMRAMNHLKPVMLQGSTSRNKRRDIFEAVRNKDQLLVISDIGNYGLNIKSLDCIVIGHPVKDSRQIVGRVCRSNDGKKHGFVIDPIDNAPFLQRHAKLRYNQYIHDNHMIIG